MNTINKLGLPATILIASIILGGFYYASESNKQASIERQHQADLQAQQAQQQADLQAQQAAQQTTTDQNNLIIYEKAACATQAQKVAINEFNNSASCTIPPADPGCYTGEFSVPQYNDAYNICLQSKGLQ